MISFGQSNPVPGTQVASTSTTRKLEISFELDFCVEEPPFATEGACGMRFALFECCGQEIEKIIAQIRATVSINGMSIVVSESIIRAEPG